MFPVQIFLVSIKEEKTFLKRNLKNKNWSTPTPPFLKAISGSLHLKEVQAQVSRAFSVIRSCMCGNLIG